MRPLLKRYFGPGLTMLGLCVWSGCEYVEQYFAPTCGPNCAHHHDHDGHDHESNDPDQAEDNDECHTHIGPSGDRLIVLGDEDYHAELVIDHQKGEVTVRILDRTGRRLVRIDQRAITLNFKHQDTPCQIQLRSVDDPGGETHQSSCFSATNDILRGDCELTGRLNVVIGGKPYTGHVAHRDRDHTQVR